MFRAVATVLVAAAFSASVFTASWAQPLDEPISYTGAVVSHTDDSVTLKPESGDAVTVPMSKDWTLVIARATSDLKVGDFIGSANFVVDENTGRSRELRIYEPGNIPEQGTHAMGRAPTLMTHGTVTKITKVAGARELTISYPDGSRRLILADDIMPIGSFPVDRARATPGLVVTAVTRKQADGVWRATRLLFKE